MNEGLYKNITSVISGDLNRLMSYLAQIASDESVPVTAFRDEILDYLGGSSKRIRSALIFLTSRLLYGSVDQKTLKLAAAVEILHNATLIHDDIIDSANTRRGKSTLHSKYDNRFAIIAGDYLLSKAISELIDLNSIEVVENFSTCLLALCRGEVEQYFAQNTTPTLEEYLRKSESKTASLFVAALKSLAIINNDNKNIDTLEEFAMHFGRAFQLRDDLKNLTDEHAKKPLYADIENGIYTAAVIFAFGENADLSAVSADNIISASRAADALNKAKKLLDKEIEAATSKIHTLPFIDQNPYTESLLALCSLLEN